jgi:hypothetical protein
VEAINIDEMRARQREFAARVRERVEAAARIERARPEVLVKELERRLAAARLDVKDTERARDDAARRYEGDLTRKREAVAALERDLEDVKKDLEGAPKGDGDDTGKEPGAPPKGRAARRRKRGGDQRTA